MDALKGRPAGDEGTPPPQFVRGSQTGNGETSVLLLGFAPVPNADDPNLGSFGSSPIVFVAVAAQYFPRAK